MDRRARLRPKSGATSLYYGAGVSAAGDSTNFRKSMLDKAMGKTAGTLPWLSNGGNASNSPSSINFISSVSDLQNKTSTMVEDITSSTLNTVNTNVNNTLKKVDSVTGLAASLGLSPSDITGSIVSTSGAKAGLGDLNGSDSLSINGASGILEPLALTDGLVFPYTPSISYGQAVEYSSYDLTHTNQEFYSYNKTKAPTISVTGEFSIQNMDEARYALAAIHFCRTVCKMDFGSGQNVGTPPPVLLFSAYGEYVFNDIDVIVTNFSMEYPKDVDYVAIPNSNSYLPMLFSISLTFAVQQTPAKARTFDLGSFRDGSLMKTKGWL